jgi:cytoskeletal protein RodZ
VIVRNSVTDIGRELAQARQRAALSLQDLSRRTKISLPILEAIERNDIKNLPGGLYTRGLLRAYAREVGCDPEDVVRRFRESLDGEFAEHEATFEEIVRTAERPHGRRSAVPPDSTDSDRRRTISQLAFIALALLGGSVAYGAFGGALRPLMHRVRANAITAPAAETAPMPPTPPPPPSSQTPTPSGQPSSSATTGSTPPAAAAADDGTAPGLRLAIQLTGPCWLSATVDGARTVYQLFSGGEQTTIDAKKDVVLRVGDPASLALTINGAMARSLGTAGEPVTVHLTPQNFHEFVSQ